MEHDPFHFIEIRESLSTVKILFSTSNSVQSQSAILFKVLIDVVLDTLLDL